MSGNANLQAAQRIRNDEFFTQLSDIEAELSHYKEHFKNQTVYCNCDHPESSNFWQFFKAHFEDYGLKRLIATFKAPDAYQATVERRDGCIALSRHRLMDGGDFRSPECVQLLRQADIVVTNPPFSLWREYMALLREHQKAFLIIGPMNAITYRATDTSGTMNHVDIYFSDHTAALHSGYGGYGTVYWSAEPIDLETLALL